MPPRVLRGAQRLAERRVGQQGHRRPVAAVGGADLVEEPGPDDAAAAPDRRHGGAVDVPAVLLAAGLDQVPALRVGHDLRGVQRLFHVLREAGRVVRVQLGTLGPRQAGRRGPQLGVAGERAGEDRLGDAGDRHPEVEGGLHRPAAGALLLGTVGDDVDERAARVGVGVRQDLGGDLDEVGVEPPRVPLAEDLRDARRLVPGHLAEQVVGLGDELHVGVLDAVVHHLDEVPRAVRADVRTARLPVDLRRNALQQRAERLVGLGRAARHDARAVQRALLATGDAAAHEVQPALLERGLAAPGVLEVGVAAVHDHVAGLQQLGELVDHRVRRGARLDHDHQSAGPLQRGHELPRRLGGNEIPLVAELLDQRPRLGGGAVVHGNGVPVPGEIAGKVAAHHRKPGDTDLCLPRHLINSCRHVSCRYCPTTGGRAVVPRSAVRVTRRGRRPVKTPRACRGRRRAAGAGGRRRPPCPRRPARNRTRRSSPAAVRGRPISGSVPHRAGRATAARSARA